MILKKRGLSSVVATVLILLITVSAVVLLATYIIPFVNNSLEGTSCFEFREYFEFDDSLGYNCHEDSFGRYIISVRGINKSAEKLEGFALRFIKGTDAEVVNVKDSVPATSIILLDWNIGSGNLVVPRINGKYSALSYNYSSTNDYEKVELYAVMKGGEVCQKSDELRIRKC